MALTMNLEEIEKEGGLTLITYVSQFQTYRQRKIYSSGNERGEKNTG